MSAVLAFRYSVLQSEGFQVYSPANVLISSELQNEFYRVHRLKYSRKIEAT